MAAEEAALLAEVAGGDAGAPLEERFRRYAGRLHTLGLGLLGGPGLAEELVEESFVRLWCQAPRYDPERGTVATFDDYWSPFLGGQGPAPAYVMTLGDDRRRRLRDGLGARVPTGEDGSIHLVSRAWAVRGRAPS